MTADQETLITPPASYWRGRATALRERPDHTPSASERDPAWDELVTWFEQHREWCELVQRIEEPQR